jgi:hypothetical protein
MCLGNYFCYGGLVGGLVVVLVGGLVGGLVVVLVGGLVGGLVGIC